MNLIENVKSFFEKELPFIRKSCKEKIKTVDINLVTSCLNIITVMCREYHEFREMQKTRKKTAVGKKAKKECKIDNNQTIETVYL